MRTLLSRTAAVTLAALGAGAPGARAENGGRLTPEPRLVLALFDGAGRTLPLDTEDPVHQGLEMPLNHLGLVVRRHDIRTGP
ncbi:MAG: hypothetical protein ACE5JG_07150, partial [Planctomycetota bacterium]